MNLIKKITTPKHKTVTVNGCTYYQVKVGNKIRLVSVHSRGKEVC